MSVLLGPDQAEGLRRMMDNGFTDSNTKIIAVTSGKGGVGKSNFTLNLGIALANMVDPVTKQPFNKKVVIMDADLGLANINVLLGIIPKYSLLHVIKGQKKLHEIIIKTEYGVELIAGASGFSQLANLSNHEIQNFIEGLMTLTYADYILIDTAAGISDSVLKFATAAHETIVITTPEPTSITDAYGIIKSFTGENSIPNLQLVVNRVKDATEAHKVSKKLADITHKFLNINLEELGYVFHSALISEAVRRQIPFSIMSPKSNVSLCIQHIAKKMMHIADTEENAGWKKFMGALFKEGEF